MSRLTENLEREVEELRAGIAARNAAILALVDVAKSVVEVSHANVKMGNYGAMWTGVDDAVLADLENHAHKAEKVVTS